MLLVYHTSRFGRNQEECIRCKRELADLGKVMVFVSQGIISGNERDFINERLNETLDEAYSRNLSSFVRGGFAAKAEQGHAIGKPPLGYRTEKSPSGRGAHLVPDPDIMPVLLEILKGYASDKHSFRTLAQELNSRGRRTGRGQPFTESSISTILNSRFYEGVVVYHRGRGDERVIPGAHQVPQEVKELWLHCQKVRRDKIDPGQPSPVAKQQRVYPLTGILICDGCGEPYHGIGSHSRNKLYPRMAHGWHRCDLRPQSASAPRLEEEFAQRVLGCVSLGDSWKEAVLAALANEGPQPDNSSEIKRVETAIANLRKQHLWSAIDDQQFKAEYQSLDRWRRTLAPSPEAHITPNLDRAAVLLSDLPALWQHPGVTPEQRRDLAREVFQEVRIRRGYLIAVKPRSQYAPLFAYSLCKQYHVAGGERSP